MQSLFLIIKAHDFSISVIAMKMGMTNHVIFLDMDTLELQNKLTNLNALWNSVRGLL